jgi:MFS family permease
MPGVAGLLAVSFLSLVSFSSFEATFSLFGNKRLGLTLSSTYVLFTVIGVLIALDQVVLVPQAVARWGERGALRAGLIINAAGLALLVGVHSLVGLVPSLLLLTAGQGLVTPTLSSAVAGQAPRRDRGRVLGVQQSVGGLARVVGPVLGGLAFGRLGVWVPYGAGAVVLVGAVTLLAVGARPGERVGSVPA